MLAFLPPAVLGVLASALIVGNTIVAVAPITLIALLKLAIPLPAWRRLCSRVLISIANGWVGFNGFIFRLLHRVEWCVEIRGDLRPDAWYLVTCNHVSWSDIPAVQKVLHRRVPMLKFFLKQQLIWVPLLGVAWWALDFPFMKRYTKAQIERNPSLRGKDLETTRRACEKFKYTPVAIFNFLEGTRFTPEKHARQQSPYRHLLLPRAGGVGFALGVMGDRLDTLLDVTLLYPDGACSFWSLLSGRIPRIVVHAETQPIPPDFLGRDYLNDEVYREAFQAWIRELWERKDALLDELHARYAARVPAERGARRANG